MYGMSPHHTHHIYGTSPCHTYVHPLNMHTHLPSIVLWCKLSGVHAMYTSLHQTATNGISMLLYHLQQPKSSIAPWELFLHHSRSVAYERNRFMSFCPNEILDDDVAVRVHANTFACFHFLHCRNSYVTSVTTIFIMPFPYWGTPTGCWGTLIRELYWGSRIEIPPPTEIHFYLPIWHHKIMMWRPEQANMMYRYTKNCIAVLSQDTKIGINFNLCIQKNFTRVCKLITTWISNWS